MWMPVFPAIFRNSCWKLAQCGWVSNTVANNFAGNIARCGRPLTLERGRELGCPSYILYVYVSIHYNHIGTSLEINYIRS